MAERLASMEATVGQFLDLGNQSGGDCNGNVLDINGRPSARIAGGTPLDAYMAPQPYPGRIWSLIFKLGQRRWYWLIAFLVAVAAGGIGGPILYELADWPSQWHGVFCWVRAHIG